MAEHHAEESQILLSRLEWVAITDVLFVDLYQLGRLCSDQIVCAFVAELTRYWRWCSGAGIPRRRPEGRAGQCCSQGRARSVERYAGKLAGYALIPDAGGLAAALSYLLGERDLTLTAACDAGQHMSDAEWLGGVAARGMPGAALARRLEFASRARDHDTA